MATFDRGDGPEAPVEDSGAPGGRQVVLGGLFCHAGGDVSLEPEEEKATSADAPRSSRSTEPRAPRGRVGLATRGDRMTGP